MHRKNYFVLLALGLVFLLASCAKEGPTGPTGPAGPSFTGSISGHVSLYDKYGSQVFTGMSNVVLSINGSAVVPSPTTKYANPDGSFQFLSVTTGNYAIAAVDTSKSQLFAPTVVSDINFLSGTLNQDIKLSAVPDSFLTAFTSVESVVALNDSLVIQAASDVRRRNCIIFVNSTVAATGYLLHYIVAIPPATTTVTLLIPQQDLLNAGFTSGKTAYYAAYSYVVSDMSVYENTGSGQNVYTAINTNAIVDSAIVP